MGLRLTFSQKILLMPAVALLAFSLLLVVNEGTGRTNARLMAQIEQDYVPGLELSHEIEATSQALQRRLQDSVAAMEPEALLEADTLRDRLLHLFDAIPQDAAAQSELRSLRSECVDYYVLARAAAEVMIRDERPANLHETLESVQTRYAALRDRLESLTRRQKAAMRAAFVSATANQRSTTQTMSLVIGSALVGLGFLSAVLISGVRRSMTHAVEVADRLSHGDFSTVVVSGADDEFGRLLAAMQRMMTYLRSIAAMADKIAGESSDAIAGVTPPEGLGRAFEKMVRAEARSRRLVEALERQEGQLSEAQRIAHLGSWEWEPRGDRLTWSKELCRIFGVGDRPPVRLDEFRAFVHPADQHIVEAGLQHALDSRSPFALDHRIVRPDGTVRTLHALGEVFVDEEGEVVRIAGTAQDLSDMLAVAAALDASETRYRALFDLHPQPMWVYEPVTLQFLAVNAMAIDHYGYSAAEFLAMTLPDLCAQGDAHMGTDASGEDAVSRHRRKDGTLLDVVVSSHDVPFGDRPARASVVTDVTEHRRLEEQLRQSQKMEAVGRLAGGVAHDFNNLLNVIVGYGELLQRKLSPEHPLQRNTSEILKAAERAANLTRQLLAFSRKQVLQPRILDMNLVVTDMEKLLRRLIGEDVELRTALQRTLAHVKADPGQVEQVIMNLVVNARDAMPRGGKLCLETKTVELDEQYARTHRCNSGPHVLLAVSDTGHGIPADVLPHIFEPFFTTKEEGKGTGLGLSTVYGIVSQSGGHTQVYSEVGRGTTVKVYLPSAGQDATVEIHAAEGPPPRGSETLLVVEDEPALREVVGEILVDGGYDVILSDGPAHAIEQVRAADKRIDLVVTDVIMPGMSGPDLIKQLETIVPIGQVLFISGYTDDAIGQHGLLEPGVHFLQKPFLSNALLKKVREVLDARLARSADDGDATSPRVSSS